MFKKILIANRGEIACRIHRSCERMGIATATVHDPADRTALHVRTIGESVESAKGYLDIKFMVEAAKKTKAEAIHPGIGFLSESPDFVSAVEQAGLIFIGPRAETMSRFADKATAKSEVRKLDIPIIKGSEQGSDDPNILGQWILDFAGKDGLTQVMLKATAGGGGRGIRAVNIGEDIRPQIESAMREANGAFGMSDLLVEQYIPAARHIEVQLLGDGKGKVVHFYERECSLQRRHQKVIEESPAIDLPVKLRNQLTQAAIKIAEACDYRSLGTIEFLVKGDQYFFLELNPRLQVEHPVTEAVIGVDLVELQLRASAAEVLPITQGEIKISGHSIEARVYAENVKDGFVPSCGVIKKIAFAEDCVRVDYGVSSGDVISPYFDPMIAKVISYEDDRSQALKVLGNAITGAVVQGVDTNLAFLSELLTDARVLRGDIDNGFIDSALDRLIDVGEVATCFYAIAGLIRLLSDRGGDQRDPWSRERFTNWRLGGCRFDQSNVKQLGGALDSIGFATKGPFLVLIQGEEKTLRFSAIDAKGQFQVLVGDELHTLMVIASGDGTEGGMRPSIQQRGHQKNELGERAVLAASCIILFENEMTLFVNYCIDQDKVEIHTPKGNVTATIVSSLAQESQNKVNKGTVTAPVMGQVVKVNVRVGDNVKSGDVIAIQESMKMELSMTAPCDGAVISLNCKEGDMIERHSFVAEVKGE